MARWNEHDSKRFALWLGVIVAPAMLVGEVVDPHKSLAWHYFALVIWSLLFASFVYRLVTERVPHA